MLVSFVLDDRDEFIVKLPSDRAQLSEFNSEFERPGQLLHLIHPLNVFLNINLQVTVATVSECQ